MNFTTIGLIFLVIIVLGLMVYIIPIIKKWANSRGININNTLITTNKIIGIIQLLVKDSNLLPVEQQFLIDNIVTIIQDAINLIQKMYMEGQCTKDKILDKVIELIFDSIKTANIIITIEQHDIIIDTAKMLVLLLS